MSIELVVFDMAGTTVQDDDAVHNSLRQALAENGVEVTRDEVNAVMGMPKPRAIRLLLEKKSENMPAPSDPEVDKIYQLFLANMVRYYEEDPRVREISGASQLFRELKAHGIRVVLDTGFSRTIVDAILKRLHWNQPELLDTTVASDEVKNGRPHADLIFEAMRRTGVTEASRVAKAGDTPADLQEGKAAGCRYIIGATYGSHTRAELSSHPHTHLVNNLQEVAGIVMGKSQAMEITAAH